MESRSPVNEQDAQLIRDLRSPLMQTRFEAADKLSRRRVNEAIPALVESLADNESKVCMAAMNSLVKIGAPAIEALIGALQSYDSGARLLAALALGDLGTAEAVPALIPLLRDANADVQSAVREALSQIGTPEAQAALRA